MTSDQLPTIADKASGPDYERFLLDMTGAGLTFVDVANVDFNGRGVIVRDLDGIRGFTSVPCTLTVVGERCVAHPVISRRVIP